MRVAIDSAGRIVVPKAVRNRLGLVPGATLELHERDGSMVFEPSVMPVRLVKRGKSWVAEPDEPLPTLTAEQVRATLESERR